MESYSSIFCNGGVQTRLVIVSFGKCPCMGQNISKVLEKTDGLAELVSKLKGLVGSYKV